jgi:BTB/POZ domain
LILCAASPVFEAMMYSKFSEGSDYLLDASNSIKITDISYETFDTFLNYIYTGELTLKDEQELDRLMELSYCAQKYLIEDLRKQCLTKLTEQLNQSTVLPFIAKSFEMHLEDILVSCLYFIADSLEAGKSFSNLLLNNENSHLSPRCFEFLIKNLLDYFGDRDDVLCLIKSWTFMQCQVENEAISDESQAVTLSKLNLDEALVEKIVQLKSSFVDGMSKILKFPRSFHRVYYKPVRPFIIERNQLSFDANISFQRFAIVNSLMVNSRLIPEQFDICDMSSQMYTENINVEIFDKASNNLLYNQRHTCDNVSFNAFFRISLNDSIILFPHHVYVIKITWSNDAIGFEYPRCIFSLLEKGNDGKVDVHKNPLSIVQFHEYNYCYNSPFGSIVQGISYDLIS